MLPSASRCQCQFLRQPDTLKTARAPYRAGNQRVTMLLLQPVRSPAVGGRAASCRSVTIIVWRLRSRPRENSRPGTAFVWRSRLPKISGRPLRLAPAPRCSPPEKLRRDQDVYPVLTAELALPLRPPPRYLTQQKCSSIALPACQR